MFIRPCYRKKNGKRHAYWALMESYRTERGPRQRVVAYLGQLDEPQRLGVKEAAEGKVSARQKRLFDDVRPQWVEVELVDRLGLKEFLQRTIPGGHEDVSWALMALVLVLCRLCDPSSELHIAAHFYAQSALEVFLKNRLGELFGLEYDLLLYDVTSTYFEGQAQRNPLAQRGYSRDHRPDCKQVCIGLVVSKCGMPLGYEVFAGNRADVTTLQEIVETMERRYIVGTPKSMLKQFERELLSEDWHAIREGLEVKLCPSPDGQETFVLCRSRDRREKEKAMHDRFQQRIEEGLKRIEASCQRQRQDPLAVAQRLGRLMGQNSRAAGLFQTEVKTATDGRAILTWKKIESWRNWAALSEGCYLLRSNVANWSDEDLWKAYIQLTEAEAAFRIHKSDLVLRPIWHQKEERVLAHILVCFLAYVLWKTLGQMCQRAGLGHEPRRLFEELGKIQLVDVVLPTRQGTEIRRRCITQLTGHQAILLAHLRLNLPVIRPMEGL
jgi:hypothetical protein